ncbi:MAG: hypothetical protein DRH26_16160 [Deltaproteobacteria bacterium]|nr:MAG: hypothetical protein DRH26_16160 [Deltaproteobacteria bacterium]
MASSIIECASNPFKILADKIGISPDSKARILPDDRYPNDTERLKSSRLKNSQEFAYGVKIHKISGLKDEKFLLICGMRDLFEDIGSHPLLNYGSVETYQYPSIFLRTLKDSSINFNITADDESLKENFFGQFEDSKYVGHDFEEVRECFEGFAVFLLDDDSILWDVSNKTLFCLILIGSKIKHLSHSGELLSLIESKIIEYSEVLPLDNLTMTLTSHHWEHAFFESYRVIEKLYSLPRALDLKNNLNLQNITAAEIAYRCNKDLGWRRIERDSIERLFRLVPINIIGGQNFFNTNIVNKYVKLSRTVRVMDNGAERILEENISDKDKMANIAFFIYAVRNQLVHYFEFKEDSEYLITDKDFKMLVTVIWKIIFFLYKEFKDELKFSKVAS